MKTLKPFAVFTAVLLCSLSMAQSTGTLKGNVTGNDGTSLPGATVKIMEDSIMVTGNVTDSNGDFVIRHIRPGIYDVEFSFIGCKTRRIKKVEFAPDQTIFLNAALVTSHELKTLVISEEYVKPILNPQYSTVTRITYDQIEHMAVTSGDIVSMITAVTPGVLASESGDKLYIRGSRSGSTAFYIDGNRIIGSPDLPGLSIAGIEVLTGGVPAEYGDCTGGLVIITTKEYKWEMHKKKQRQQKYEESLIKDIAEE